MLILSKKGLAQETIVKGVLLLVGFGLVAYFVTMQVIPIAQENNERATCRTTVDINAKRFTAPVVGGELHGGIVDVNCQTIQREIKGSNKEQVFGQLADLMAMAWEDFRRGEKKIHEDKTAVFCMPRYAPITFKEKDKVYSQFYEYLATEEPIGKDETYGSFLLNHEMTAQERNQFIATPDFINSNRDYAVIFVLAKESSMDAFYDTLRVAGAVLIATTVTAFTAGLGGAAAVPLAAWLIGGVVGGTVLAVEELTELNPSEILEHGLTSSYGVGSNEGDDFAARLWLIPYDNIAELDCDQLVLKTYTTPDAKKKEIEIPQNENPKISEA